MGGNEDAETPKAFNWADDGALPVLEAHSAAKLRVVAEYIRDYVRILCSASHGVETFRLTIVDGFCGGGRYDGGEEGSPLRMIRAVQEAEFCLNSADRTKPISIDCHFHFVDAEKKAVECLKYELTRAGFDGLIGKSVFLHSNRFEDALGAIIAQIVKRHPKGGGRSIFLLDQCGYTKVKPSCLKDVAKHLNYRAEFIVNLAVAWLIDFLDADRLGPLLELLGLRDAIDADKVLRLKKDKSLGWRYLIESSIGEAFVQATGAPFFSPFYIEPQSGHRGYWLLHLAWKERAKRAMMDVLWRQNGIVHHYGYAGYGMLAYKPDADQTGYLNGMDLGSLTRTRAKSLLTDDFGRLLVNSFSSGVDVGAFRTHQINSTLANDDLVDETLQVLAERGEIELRGPGGKAKRGGSITANDQILPVKQLKLFPLPPAPKPKL